MPLYHINTLVVGFSVNGSSDIVDDKTIKSLYRDLLSFLSMIEFGRQINESSVRGQIDCITGGPLANLAPSEPAHVCSRITTFVLYCALWNHWPAPLLTHGFQRCITDRILFFITSLWYIFVAQFTMAFPFFCFIQYHPSDEKNELIFI